MNKKQKREKIKQVSISLTKNGEYPTINDVMNKTGGDRNEVTRIRREMREERLHEITVSAKSETIQKLSESIATMVVDTCTKKTSTLELQVEELENELHAQIQSIQEKEQAYKQKRLKLEATIKKRDEELALFNHQIQEQQNTQHQVSTLSKQQVASLEKENSHLAAQLEEMSKLTLKKEDLNPLYLRNS
ncbi:DUF3450 domain-containing protein [Vibrio sp. SS-MA-C1-2]|uniref:DNA-binding protein n=1 Tax=Vibrio sp. SS-MA-C1-2 TaxID=2908646 RepID=UPI001F1F34F3|nr:DNA-binding protein [Vibrio sp. SS-MA-C1-2]UJF17612.1 DUF3450 domain-containing protein [Vibrio sp. SS-MA-C1-2]